MRFVRVFVSDCVRKLVKGVGVVVLVCVVVM